MLFTSRSRCAHAKRLTHRSCKLRLQDLESRLTPAGIPPLFVTPLAGIPYQDWTIVSYVDLDDGPGTLDWAGRVGDDAYTRDGHEGIDFVLPNFAAQDVGVPVFAAAPGIVVAVRDGLADRNTQFGQGPDLGNFVRIDHGDGWMTDYGHLRRDSVAVRIGQSVKAGDVIGLVGSSGNSTGPHLHFNVLEDGMQIETYGNPDRTFWVRPLDYAGDRVGVLDSGITDFAATVDQLKNRPGDRDVLRVGQTANFWVNLYGTKRDDTLDFRWYRNDVEVRSNVLPGRLLAPDRFVWHQDQQLVDAAGTWRVVLEHTGVVLASKEFEVVADPLRESPGWFEFSAPEYHITENGFDALVKVTRHGGSRGRASLDISIINVTAGRDDYFGSTTQSILFNPGQVEAHADFFLPIKQDDHWEMPETVTLFLSNPTGGASLGARGSATLTIHDDGDQVKFITPLGGVPFVDWTIGNYTDRDPVPMEGENTQTHTSDYKHFKEQDAYTYDGHNGLDISLAHFAAQDAGIPVYAAADGVVIEVHDGEWDRNTSWDGDPPANEVKIDHGNGLVTSYEHLRQNSVAVAVGQIVRAGHVLGLVGSSGVSDRSHLHFEVRQDGTPIETYLDPERFWQNPLPYTAERPGVKDFGLATHEPTDDELRERPDDRDVVVAASPTRVWFWTYLHGVDDRYVQYLGSEDELNFRWYYQGLPVPSDPPFSANIHGGWKVASYLVNLPGNWRVDLEINQNVVASKSFKVVAKAVHELVGNFEFSAPTYHTTENREFAEIRVRRTGGARGGASVFLEVHDGTALRNADYGDKSGWLHFADGEVERKIEIPIVDNPYPEFAENVLLKLKNPTNGAGIGMRKGAQLLIHDSADPPTVAKNGSDWDVLGRDLDSAAGRDQFSLRRLERQILLDAVYYPELGVGPNEVYQWTFGPSDIMIDTRKGHDVVTVDFHPGNPLHIVGLTFRGGDGADRIRALADLDFELSDAFGGLFLPGFQGGSVYLDAFEDAELVGGPAANTFTTDWSGRPFLDGMGGGDEYLVTHTGPGGQVYDHGGNGNDRLTVSDSVGAIAWRIGTDLVEADGRRFFFGYMEELNVNTGDAFNAVRIEGTSRKVPTTVNTGQGNDAILVPWALTQAGLGRPRTVPYVNLYGGFDSDTLIVDDIDNTLNDSYTVAARSISASRPLGVAPARIDYFSFESVELRLGSGASRVNVEGTSWNTTTAIDGGRGDDTFDVRNTFDGEGDSLNGPLYLRGAEHNVGDRLYVADRNFPYFLEPFDVTPTTITRSGIAIDYRTIEGVVVNGRNVFSVNTTSDTSDANVGDGFARNALNRVSLRAALQEANALPGSDLILFDIPGGGIRSIAPLTSLPKVSDPVTIDATTQPGYNGTPLVELNGRMLIQTGLTLSAGNSTVRGLAINRFRGPGIRIADRGGNRIVGNYIGTDGTGTIPRGNLGDGVRIERSSGNIIGDTGPGEANLIANNVGDGVSVVGTVPAGMVSLWRGDGNADDSIETNHGSMVPGAGYGPGKVGQAFAFDGFNDYVEFPDHPSLTVSSFTLDAWVKPVDLGDSLVIVSKYNSAEAHGVSWSLGTTPGGKLYLFVCQTFSNNVITYRSVTTNVPALTVGAWQHVAASFDLATQAMRIFVNGVELAATLSPESSVLTSVLDSPTPVRIGTYFASGTEIGPVDHWQGAIDEVGLTARVLSPAEIRAIVNTGSSGRRLAIENAIRGNSIRDNAGLAIDLNDDGPTLNDAPEVFGGANRGQNTPTLRSVLIGDGTIYVTWDIQSRPNRNFTVDFYFGPEQRFVGSVTVTTNESGFVEWTTLFSEAFVGESLVVTATDENGNTSEFSDPLTLA